MEQANLLETLRNKWYALLRPMAVDEELVEELFADLVTRYGEDGRFYHTLEHIHNVLTVVEELQHLAQYPVALQLAAWYHDVIYEMGASDNEAKSAAYAGQILKRLALSGDAIATVKRTILATDIYHNPPKEIESQILVDADLATFAAGDEQYTQYNQNIRQEFAFVPEAQYRQGRRKILTLFWQRERIFHTDQMFTALETRARQNIKREIESLA